MTDASEDLEILKEFGAESLEILAEFPNIQERLQSYVDHGNLDDLEGLGSFARHINAMAGSGEFLGLDVVYQLCVEIGSSLSDLDTSEKDLSQGELDLWIRSFEVLKRILAQVAKEGSATGTQSEAYPIIESFKGGFEEASAPPAKASAKPEYTPSPKGPEPKPAEQPSQDFSDPFQIKITEEMLTTFISEAEEQLEMVEESLLQLERDLSDHEAINNAFRGMHTFKGNCGLFNYSQLEKLGHDFESLLEELKSGTRKCEHRGISVMLKVLDALKVSVHGLPDSEGRVDNFDGIYSMLQDYLVKGEIVNVVSKGNATLLGEILIELGFVNQSDLEKALQRQQQSLGEILQDLSNLNDKQLGLALEVQKERRLNSGKETSRKRTSNQNIRVDLDKLDELMNLVGELIISENMVTHNPDLEGHDFENFKKASMQLNRISRDLQSVSMSLRMVPIDATFRKMVRVVRDLSIKQGKQIKLEVFGEDTEVDKSIVENISDPLLHIVRNAIDHGIENPDQRAAANKPATGMIELQASHQGGEIFIKIRDDGRGLDKDKILKKAREKGIINSFDTFTKDRDIYSLIFEPGFSTATHVTDISGRGVGMDVVKKNIEKIKGQVEINSRLGHGTEFTLRIPLTLAIIDGMLIRVFSQLYTVPLLSIFESLRIHQDQVTRTVNGQEYVRIRDRLIPILRLHRQFFNDNRPLNLEDGILVVVEHHGERLCLFVDEILGQYQTVIKGLSDYLGRIRGISGSSILSNGDISLILDVPSLIESSAKPPEN